MNEHADVPAGGGARALRAIADRDRSGAARRDIRADERDAAGHGLAVAIERLGRDVHVRRIEAALVEHGAIDPRLAGTAAVHRMRDPEALLRAGSRGQQRQRDADDHRARPDHDRPSAGSASRYSSSVKPRTSRSPRTSTGTRRKPSSWTRYLSTSASVGAVSRTLSEPALASSRRVPRASVSVPARSIGAASTRGLSKGSPRCKRNSLAFSQVGQPFLL